MNIDNWFWVIVAMLFSVMAVIITADNADAQMPPQAICRPLEDLFGFAERNEIAFWGVDRNGWTMVIVGEANHTNHGVFVVQPNSDQGCLIGEGIQWDNNTWPDVFDEFLGDPT